MTCDAAKNDFTLYLYCELDFNAEEALEQHLHDCASCSEELERVRAFHAAFDQQDWQPSAELLQACRRELQTRIDPLRVAAHESWWARAQRFVSSRLASPIVLKPLGAMALLALGFLGARLWDATRRVSEPSMVRVRNLSASDDGGIQLVLEEVRQKTVNGRLDDVRVRAMLLAAASDPSDAGLRARSLEVLKDRCDQSDIRQVLLQALARDTNPGVRLKAIEGLKQFARDPETRRVLSGALLTDDNPGVRTRAVDLLVDNMQLEVIGTLQELMIRENNPYIRQKGLKALREANASVETF